MHSNNEVSTKNLSQREHQVFERLASGQPIKTMADELQVAPDTIKKHLSSIYKKLGARNGREAIWKALMNGFFESKKQT